MLYDKVGKKLHHDVLFYMEVVTFGPLLKWKFKIFSHLAAYSRIANNWVWLSLITERSIDFVGINNPGGTRICVARVSKFGPRFNENCSKNDTPF